MGVLLTPILKREQTSFKALYGKSFAVDASIELHQFLALIRKPDGSLFTDPQGRVTLRRATKSSQESHDRSKEKGSAESAD
ncbi:hypothetical protein E6H15_04835 [Candidatus Bathyarchaeota archaeon]|nr:MAG: hypothetical protein E6H15_04835 [Candidatus Bathyarchaeota archaeon]